MLYWGSLLAYLSGYPGDLTQLGPGFLALGDTLVHTLAAGPSSYRSYVLHVHLITIKVGVVRRCADSC